MNVLISGLTGSGKSTTAKALGTRLGCKVYYGSRIRAKALGVSTHKLDRRYWLLRKEGIVHDTRRLDSYEVDVEVDRRLIEITKGGGLKVMDVWFLPWLKPRNSFSVFLDLGLDARVDRLMNEEAFSHAPRQEVVSSVDAKDRRAIEYARNAYNVDIGSNRDPFNAVFVPNPGTLPSEIVLVLSSMISDCQKGSPILTHGTKLLIDQLGISVNFPSLTKYQC